MQHDELDLASRPCRAAIAPQELEALQYWLPLCFGGEGWEATLAFPQITPTCSGWFRG